MFKLNNKGWGLSSMIVCITLILVALLIATFYALRLYSQLDRIRNNSSTKPNSSIITINYEDYYKMENSLSEAASNYIRDLGIELSEISYNVNYDTLKVHGYVDKIIDTETFRECRGYAVVYNSKYSEAYIKCDSYTSKGYNE